TRTSGTQTTEFETWITCPSVPAAPPEETDSPVPSPRTRCRKTPPTPGNARLRERPGCFSTPRADRTPPNHRGGGGPGDGSERTVAALPSNRRSARDDAGTLRENPVTHCEIFGLGGVPVQRRRHPPLSLQPMRGS